MGQNNQKDQKGPKMTAAVMLVQNNQNNQKIWSSQISYTILKVRFFWDTLYKYEYNREKIRNTGVDQQDQSIHLQLPDIVCLKLVERIQEERTPSCFPVVREESLGPPGRFEFELHRN